MLIKRKRIKGTLILTRVRATSTWECTGCIYAYYESEKRKFCELNNIRNFYDRKYQFCIENYTGLFSNYFYIYVEEAQNHKRESNINKNN